MTRNQRIMVVAFGGLITVTAFATQRDALLNLINAGNNNVMTATDAANRLAGTSGMTEKDALEYAVANGVVFNIPTSKGYVVPASGYFDSTVEFKDSASVALGDLGWIEMYADWRRARIRQTGDALGVKFYFGMPDDDIVAAYLRVWRWVPEGGGYATLVATSENFIAQLDSATLCTVLFEHGLAVEEGDFTTLVLASTDSVSGYQFALTSAADSNTVDEETLRYIEGEAWVDAIMRYAVAPATADSFTINYDSTMVCTDSLGTWQWTDSLVSFNDSLVITPDTLAIIITDSLYTCVDSAWTDVYVDSLGWIFGWVCTDSSWVYEDSLVLGTPDSLHVYSDSLYTPIDSALVFACTDSAWAWSDSLLIDNHPARWPLLAPQATYRWAYADTLAVGLIKWQVLMQSPQVLALGDQTIYEGLADIGSTRDALQDTAMIDTSGIARSYSSVQRATFQNLGTVDETTDGIERSIDRVLVALRPSMVIMSVGRQDYSRVPLDRSYRNIKAVLDVSARDSLNIVPVLLTVPHYGNELAAYSRSIDSLNIMLWTNTPTHASLPFVMSLDAFTISGVSSPGSYNIDGGLISGGFTSNGFDSMATALKRRVLTTRVAR